MTQDALTINADCNFGIATLSKDGEVIASANVVGGVAELTFAPFSEVTTYDLVVIGYNKVTYVGTVEVLPAAGAYVSVDSFTPGTVPVAEEQQMSMMPFPAHKVVKRYIRGILEGKLPLR